MGVIIRRAQMSDIPFMADMLKKLFEIEEDFTADPALQERGLELLINDTGRSAVFAAGDSDGICGMVTGQLVVSTAAGGYSVLLEDLYVIPSMRGCGVGGSLIDELAKWGRSSGACRIQLVADSENSAALDFYRCRNFTSSRMTGLYRYLGQASPS